jgi:hypothetical protein
MHAGMPGLLVIAIGLGVAAPAGAGNDEAERPRRRDGYAPGIILADALSTALVIGGVAVAREYADCECEEFGSGYLILFGGGGYLMGAPMLHHEHGRSGRTWQSAALRLTLPALGLLVARGLDPPDEHDRGELDEASGWLFLGGAIAAMTIDWAISF